MTYISQQRNLYAYLHDQTLRLMNQGYTGIEIAEMIEMPPALEAAWHTHGYYGSVSHNVKAIYQRYLGWFDGNPAHLWQHPPVEAGTRYVDAFGGADVVIAKAQRVHRRGDLRFAAELLNHVVFADDTNTAAREAARKRLRDARLRCRKRHVAQLLPPGRRRAAERCQRLGRRPGGRDRMS